MNEVLALVLVLVVLFPVPADGQNSASSLINSDDVWQGNAGLVAIFVYVFVARQVVVDVHFKDFVAVV